MGHDYRDELFAAYDLHAARLDPDHEAKLEWFRAYAGANYLPHLQRLDPDSSSVLEIGCNKGYLLKILTELGYRRLHGIDASPGDIAVAQQLVPDADIQCVDAAAYLSERKGSYDAIVLKAVLEHVPKGDVLPLLNCITESLAPAGLLIVDVPNMDWLFSGHERYMDFTHEVGFTRESLLQTISTVLPMVEVFPVDTMLQGRRGRLQRGFARRIIGTLLSWADAEGAQNPIWSRNLIAVGRKEVATRPEETQRIS